MKDDVGNMGLEALQDVVDEINAFKQSKLGRFYDETFTELRDESRDLALDSVPKDVREVIEREQHNGAYRAFKRAAGFFDELAAELNQIIKDG